MMKQIGKALATLLVYLETRESDWTEDDDLRALEHAVTELNEASDDERSAVADALVRLGRSDLLEGFDLRGSRQ